MKRTIIIALTILLNLSVSAEKTPMWRTLGKTVQVKGGVGIEQFVEAIFGIKRDDWDYDPEFDKRNGYFHYFQEGDGHTSYYVSYWNRKDGKKLVLVSYDTTEFGKRIEKRTSPWGCMSTFKVDAESVGSDEGIITDTGFRAYLYDDVKKQLVPLPSPPFNGFDNPVQKHYLLQLPQHGKDIRVREQTGYCEHVYHLLKWNGMTFDFERIGNDIASFYGTEPKINIRTAPNGKIVYTTPQTGSYCFNIIKVENGWCLIDGNSIYEAEESIDTDLKGSDTGYWVHSSCIGAKGVGAGGVTLYASPDEKSQVAFKSDDETLIEPIEIRGEWVKVRASASKKEGWMRNDMICSNPLTNCC